MIDDAPRMRIVVAEPTVPDCALSAMPGTCDWSVPATLLTGADAMMSAAETEATTAACAFRSWLPAVPVTTICDRLTVDAVICTVMVVV